MKIYDPTERMMEFVRRWLSYPAAALDIVEPESISARQLRWVVLELPFSAENMQLPSRH